MKNILKYICLFSMLVWFFPVCVHAESPTYLELESGVCYTNFYRVSNNNYRQSYSENVRVVFIKSSESASTGALFRVFDDVFTYTSVTGSGTSCSTSPRNPDTVVVDGITYYVARTNNVITSSLSSDIPQIVDNQNSDARGVYYTYGEGAVHPVGPTPTPINWGLLRDVEYSTRIAGNGSAAIRNIDYLYWDTSVDANGNDISECTVEIQAVPGNFSGSTYENLLNQTYQNFNIGNYGAVNLGTLPATSGTFSVSWSYILNHLGWSADSLYAHLENELWLKTGWYYQIRLLGSDGYTGQWQTMYTPLSQGAKASETVINQNSFNMNIYQVYEELTQINNNTSITINIEDTDYTVQNPDDGDEPQEGTDLWDILKQMLNGIFQIVKNIAALPGKFLEMIKSLFMLPNDYSDFGERLDSEVNNYMEENQPGLLAIQDGTAEIKETLEATSPSGSGQYPQCTFTWDAVTLDLSDFNAGNVTFFAAGSFDFTAAFIQMIEGFGMTYSDYQFYTSAVIYLWVVVFIYRHVNTFLKGGGETKSG